METIIRQITSDEKNNTEIIELAAKILAGGGLVAFPTETVYGLGGDAFDETAAERIYAAKGRPSDNPLIVHISKVEDLAELSNAVPQKAYELAKIFWPGPLTMIVPKNDRVPHTVTGGLETVAVRLPSHPVARKLIEQSGTFVAAPSANVSGRPSPTMAAHVIEDLSGRIDMIIDDGEIEIGLESTIVDLTDKIPVILRPGFITKEMLEAVVGEVGIDPALMTGVSGDVKPKAPGMKYRHYAPKAGITVFEGEDADVLAAILKAANEALAQNKKVGILVSDELAKDIAVGEVISLGSKGNVSEIAAHLFAALRSFDELEVDVIFAEAFSREGVGAAVMNRLLKAAGQHIVEV